MGACSTIRLALRYSAIPLQTNAWNNRADSRIGWRRIVIGRSNRRFPSASIFAREDIDALRNEIYAREKQTEL